MDEILQGFRRAIAAGDTTAMARLAAAECRMEGHQYYNVRRITDAWARIEVCSRCLGTRGIRRCQIESPPIFAVSKFPTAKIFHAVISTSSNGFIHTLCGKRFGIFDEKELLGKASKAVNCQSCHRTLANNKPRFYSSSRVTAATLTPLREIMGHASRYLSELLISRAETVDEGLYSH